MKKILSLFVIVLLASSCSGGDVRKNLGLTKSAPDEFMVLSHPPLSVPPDFNLVSPASPSLSSDKTVQEAREVVLKSKTPKNRATGVDKSLLNKADVADADPNIRDVIEQENKEMEAARILSAPKEEEEEEGFFSGLLSSVVPDRKEPVVDADAEKERLNKNKAEGKPVTEGEVPTVNKENNVLDKILN